MTDPNSSGEGAGLSTRSVEVVVALLLLAFGATIVFDSYRLGASWGADGPQSGYFPFYIGGLICLAAVATLMQAFVGKGAAFEGNKGLKLADFTDGAAQTMLFAEAGRPVPWTKPEDLDFLAGQPLPQLGGTFADTFRFACGDGQVRELPSGWAPHPRRPRPRTAGPPERASGDEANQHPVT